MFKLFSMEDSNTESSNDLLIDKIIKQTKQPENPLSLTTDILKQRQQLEVQISEQLQKSPDSEESDTTNDEDDSGDEDTNEDTSDEGSDSDDSDSEDSEESEDESETDEVDDGDSEETDDEDDEKDEVEKDEDDTSDAEEEDSLNDLIGSALNEKDDSKDKKEDKKKEVAKESFKSPVPKKKKHLKDIFTPIVKEYENYLKGMSQYGMESEATPIEKQPIVYVKESVLESLDNLVEASRVYVENNVNFVNTASTASKELNERLTIFSQYVEAEKYHFTHQLVDDKDILGMVANTSTAEPRDTVKVLLKYVDNVNQAIIYALGNSYDNLASSFGNSDFELKGDDLVYKTMLPGFNTVQVHLEEYRNYLSTNVQEFEFYKLKVMKTEDLYNLKSIGLTEDKDLVYLVDSMNKLFGRLISTVDNVSDVTTNFNKLIDEVKVIRYDVEKGNGNDLTQIGIDAKVQDFIRFKLAIEAFYINYNLMSDYLVGLFSVLNIVVDLKE
ncbi:hypothetical protein AGENTSMITH_31 [Bacillus phage vB_BspM_AgentSmith]|nr:hypothetical protein AGENTSMITH_31 [Bacillus phage vB_BspM_AgentSmith]